MEAPREALSMIRHYFEAGQQESKYRERIMKLGAQGDCSGRAVVLNSGDRVLVPELFYDPNRFAFFDSLSLSALSAFHFVVFDLLPLTHPQYFPALVPHELISRYFRLIRNAVHVGFISRATQRAYLRRLCRNGRDPGVVFRLGSDGLGPRPTQDSTHSNLPTFVVVGTVEPRKNHRMILDALAELLMRQPPSFRLIFAGRMAWVDEAVSTRIRSLSAKDGPFSFVEHPDDETLRRLLGSARASIFLSSAEGFGLPPCESLWLGVPVIASQGIPSLEDIGESGIHLVDPVNSENIQQAVVALLDESYHQKKVQEASLLTLPTWRSFAQQVASWIANR